MYKVPSPFNSPFAKVILTVFWCAYVGMLVALVVDFDINLFIIAGWWTFVLPWLTWSFLSGVQVEPGKRAGGGPMYPRVTLEPGEEVRFNAPALAPVSTEHVFVTDRRLIVLPIRFYGRVRTIGIDSITSVGTESSGRGWPFPKESVTVEADGKRTTLRPSVAPRILTRFMGVLEGVRRRYHPRPRVRRPPSNPARSGGGTKHDVRAFKSRPVNR